MELIIKNLTTERILRMVENIEYLNPDCEFKVPVDMFCHASKVCTSAEAKHSIKDFIDNFNSRDTTHQTTWEVWHRKFDKNGNIVGCFITAHNKTIDNFNPSLFGSLD